MQIVFATTITAHLVPDHLVATHPPNNMPKNWIAPPGMSMYCDSRVLKPKLVMLMLAKL